MVGARVELGLQELQPSRVLEEECLPQRAAVPLSVRKLRQFLPRACSPLALALVTGRWPVAPKSAASEGGSRWLTRLALQLGCRLALHAAGRCALLAPCPTRPIAISKPCDSYAIAGTALSKPSPIRIRRLRERRGSPWPITSYFKIAQCRPYDATFLYNKALSLCTMERGAVPKPPTLHEHATRLLALAASAQERGNTELAENLTLRATQIFDRAEARAERPAIINAGAGGMSVLEAKRKWPRWKPL